MPAPMTYREVEPSDGGARFNGEGGIRKQWWWQVGPVDSCCFCCSLRTGVGFLAASDLLYDGIYRSFYAREHTKEMFHLLLEQLQSMYAARCVGREVQSDECVELSHSIEQMLHGIDYMDSVPTMAYVLGALSIMAGLVGLFAVFRSNALAAKVYLWSWLPKFLVSMAVFHIGQKKAKEFGMDEHPGTTVYIMIISVILIVYYVKVSWSYYHRLKRSSVYYSSVPQAEENIQLAGRYDGVV